jgi:predicted enzyme involved in methoxymalonyl-ACP biosynthesis
MVRGELTTFFMSCRVQRKRVEHAIFTYLAARLCAAEHPTFLVRFTATDRNGASSALLAELGFTQDTDREIWIRDTAVPFPDATIVHLAVTPAHVS